MKAQRCDARSTLEIKQHVLLEELRSATIYWFRIKKALSTNANDDAIQMIVSSCVKILHNGFRLNWKSTFYQASSAAEESKKNDSIKRLIDDFEFLRMDYASGSKPASIPPLFQSPESVEDFLRSWVVRCLMTHTLSQCLQSLVTDKELLEYYYNTDAFMRQSYYATALFICLSAVELNQYNLLSQLDLHLLKSPHILLKPQQTLHRRTISHPNFAVSPHKLSTVQEEIKTANLVTSTPQRTVAINSLPIFRRIKSLPCIELDTTPATTTLRRCRTFTTPTAESVPIKRPAKPFKSMYNNRSKFVQTDLGSSLSPSLFSTDELDMMPSTSAGSKRSHTSTESSTTFNSLASSSSLNSNTSSQRIQIINCDNIKIWTDQSLEQEQQSVPKGIEGKPTTTDANKIRIKRFQTKSSSPINNFFANLFGSPPAYTSWSLNYTENCSNEDVQSPDGIAVLDTFLPINGKKLRKRNSQSLFQDGVSMLDYTTSPTSSGSNIPRHSPTTPVDIMPHASVSTVSTRSDESIPKADNQSLAAFLQMSRYSRNNTDLEKENAHFRISEACISAIEHVKWAKQKQTKVERNSNGNISSSISYNNIDLISSRSCENIPYAHAEMGDNSRELLSAETVGLTLISKFNDQQLPKVSDLKWLVSEDDTPQKMLPMPTSFTESQPFDVIPSMTRGTKFWAPPRQQIIFTEHSPLNRIDLLHKQNYRCAGCGMRITKQFMQHFRYCTYLGKYLCTGCHRNQISAIPAKILQAWDFRCYPVSVFAYRLIEQMYTFPLFYVPDLNPKLYLKFGVLATACHKRKQLKLIKDFIKTCRFATREQVYFHDVPDHITADPDMWSMADFVDVQQKSMHRSIDELMALCEEHVLNCVLCTGRGFVCENCKDQRVLYTWQSKVDRCLRCGACFHQKCWKSMSKTCPRCERLNKRQNNS